MFGDWSAIIGPVGSISGYAPPHVWSCDHVSSMGRYGPSCGGLVRHGQTTSLWVYEKKLSMSTPAYIIIICRHGTSWGLHGGSMRNMLINSPLVFYLLLSKPKVLNNIVVPDGKVGTR